MNKKFEMKKTFKVEKDFRMEPGIKYEDDTLLSNVSPIEQGGMQPFDEMPLEALVEYPLLDATKRLYEKGIRTSMSSANRKDIDMGVVYIDILSDSLSSVNKRFLTDEGYEELETHGSVPTNIFKLTMKIDDSTTVGDVRRKFAELVDKFEDQN